MSVIQIPTALNKAHQLKPIVTEQEKARAKEMSERLARQLHEFHVENERIHKLNLLIARARELGAM